MEIATVKCKCGWTGQVYKGKIRAIYCPRCNKKLWIEKPEVKVKKKVRKRGRKRSSTTR
ncbi:MAG: hypothetical protein J7K36_08955 [Archaeoglobaceae archaeon]|nr:hypothetical protein [Archaeoglobaceae archaeon]